MSTQHDSHELPPVEETDAAGREKPDVTPPSEMGATDYDEGGTVFTVITSTDGNPDAWVRGDNAVHLDQRL